MSKERTLLIVDDEEDLRDTVEFKFKAKGFKVETAFDGLDALEKVDEIKPDLIILDMNMPRMNGLEFYEKIKGENEKPKYPVLVLTARANMEQLFLDLDVDGFMAKPFDLDELYKEGESILKKNSGSIKKGAAINDVRSRRVCIVDNDVEVSNKFALAFLESGYIVNTAQSGASAIKRVERDMPDVVLISLGLKDISGDIVIGKMKRFANAEKMKFVLYSDKSADRAQVTQKISQKGGVDQFVEFIGVEDILDAVESL